MEAPSSNGVESMPPPGSLLATGDSLPQVDAGIFGLSAQRDRPKIFKRRALLCGECVIPVDRAPPRHQNPRSAHGSLYRRFSSCAWRHYVETLVLCKTPYPLGARSPLYEGGSAFA